MQQQTFLPLQPKIVLGIAAHPDDLDFGAGGTLAHFARQGADVHYLQLTDGGKGTADPNLTPAQLAEIRKKEQEAACTCIGGCGVHYLEYSDGTLQPTQEVKEHIVRVIRTIKPDVVITTDPTFVYDEQYGIINHTDHRAAGEAALDAVYPLARDHLAFPHLYESGLKPHKVKTVLLTKFSAHNYYIDITATFETKMEAVRAHDSQVGDYEAMRQMFTDMARAAGKQAGTKYAEGFVRLDLMP